MFQKYGMKYAEYFLVKYPKKQFSAQYDDFSEL